MDNHTGHDGNGDERQGVTAGTGDGALAGLAELIDEQPGPAASKENLTSVLRRHVRRRRRVTSGIVAVTLALGVGGGVAIGEAVSTVATGTPFAAGHAGAPSARRSTAGSSTVVPGPTLPLPTTAAHKSATASLPLGLVYAPNASLGDKLKPPLTDSGDSSSFCTVNGCGVSYGGDYLFAGDQLHLLFARTANAVTARAFTSRYDAVQSLPVVVRACEPSDALLVEVSDARAVGAVAVPDLTQPAGRVAVAEDEVVGQSEGAPMAVVAVRAGAGIAAVEARFATGTSDEMRVVDGWGVLVAGLPGNGSSPYTESAANVEAFSADGAVVERFTVQGPDIALPTECVVAMPAGAGGPEKPQTPSTAKGASSG
jgi:hypothetical protein